MELEGVPFVPKITLRKLGFSSTLDTRKWEELREERKVTKSRSEILKGVTNDTEIYSTVVFFLG